jgi:hypothetical protein
VTAVHNILIVLEPDRHAEEDELERYSLGEVASDECARLEEHLLVCEACRERLAGHDLFTRSFAGAAADWRAGHPEVEKRRWWFPRLAVVMGALALLAVGALWLNRSIPQRIPAPVAIALSTTRGAAAAAHAPAQRPLDLKPDLTGLAVFPTYDLQVVDGIGGMVVKVKAAPQAAARISALQPGTYFVRLYSPLGELLREYALQVTE